LLAISTESEYNKRMIYTGWAGKDLRRIKVTVVVEW
jgi:hypothetical protein